MASEHLHSWKTEALNPQRKRRWCSDWILSGPLSAFLAAQWLPACFSRVLTLVASSASPVPSLAFHICEILDLLLCDTGSQVVRCDAGAAETELSQGHRSTRSGQEFQTGLHVP